jgi:hypothetical protein
MVSGVTYYFELYCSITLYYGSHSLPTKVKLVVWTLCNNNIFYLVVVYINDVSNTRLQLPSDVKYHKLCSKIDV